MNIKDRIKELVKQYNSFIENKQKMHDSAQRCLGAIETLQEFEKDEECQDSVKKAKKG